MFLMPVKTLINNSVEVTQKDLNDLKDIYNKARRVCDIKTCNQACVYIQITQYQAEY